MTNLDSVFKSRRHHVANKGPSSQSCGFSSSRMRVEPLKRLSTEELMLLNCVAGEDSGESLGQQGDQTNQS